ncbi:MAG: prepilin-type N-terminal cleavage/methylation domain-containing protein [Bdellovibrionales bacterium]|nr:prepilin-type N-terminal cleavage/methylation domain-containing protein [Bdellovibrionales bacterium]
MRSEAGFTLIELLTIIGIIGILASLSLTSYVYYKASAAYAVAETGMHDAQTAFEAGIVDPDNLPPSFALVSQTAQGPIQDAVASQLLPGYRVPRSAKFQVAFDKTCAANEDSMAYMQLNHCQGDQYITWERFCDGVTIRLSISGEGCS